MSTTVLCKINTNLICNVNMIINHLFCVSVIQWHMCYSVCVRCRSGADRPPGGVSGRGSCHAGLCWVFLRLMKNMSFMSSPVWWRAVFPLQYRTFPMIQHLWVLSVHYNVCVCVYINLMSQNTFYIHRMNFHLRISPKKKLIYMRYGFDSLPRTQWRL